VAEAWMNDNGSTQVSAVNGGPLDHGGCALLSILGGTVWINMQADLCNPIAVTEAGKMELSWSPLAEGARVTGMTAGTAWTLFDAEGRVLEAGIASGGPEWMGLPGGMSLLRTDDGRVLRLVRQ